MKLQSKCKFCGKGLELDIDDTYYQLGDPHKFIQMAACNRCADLRGRRRSLLESIKLICHILLTETNAAVVKEMKEEARGPLRNVLMKYRDLAEDWHNGDCGDWDEAMVDAILGSPKHYGNVLSKIWTLSRQPKAML